MNMVNGYVCQNCADVELAKRGVDPAHPKRRPEDRVGAAPAIQLGENRPASSGPVGTKLDMLG